MRLSLCARGACYSMLVLTLVACQGDDGAVEGESATSRVMRQLAQAESGERVEIPAGHYEFDQPLRLNQPGVMLVGAGPSQTVLSFAAQLDAEPSVQLSADQVRLENLSIKDAPSIGLLIDGAQQVRVQSVALAWSDSDKAAATGIQVSESRRLLLDQISLAGATETGIAVQRSRDVIVRASQIEQSLIGIDLRNVQRGDLYDNQILLNGLGVRVINALDSTVSGYSVRIFDNDVQRNNRSNPASEDPQWASLWHGVGIQIDGGDAVELFGNRLAGHDTADILVQAVSADAQTEAAAVLDRYPESIYVHDNLYGDGGTQPEGFKLKWIRWTQFGLGGRLPPILWDGRLDPAKQMNDQTPTHLRLCVPEGEASVLNLDLQNDYANPAVDAQWHHCRLPSLPEVQLNW